MSIFDHLEELRDRLLIAVAAVGLAIVGCFVFAKDLIVLLEKPVYSLGVRFLALSPGEYFFTTLKVVILLLIHIRILFNLWLYQLSSGINCLLK